MYCPKCSRDDSKVVDSRPHALGKYRRRRCLVCHTRYTTMETLYVKSEELEGALPEKPVQKQPVAPDPFRKPTRITANNSW